MIEEDQLILSDLFWGSVSLEMRTLQGETVLYDPEGSYFFYSSRDRMQEALHVQQRIDRLEADVYEQRWLDILKQGEWTYEVRGIVYNMAFTEYDFTVTNIYQGIENEQTFEYYIEEMEIEEDHVRVRMQRRRQGRDPVFLLAEFTITETHTHFVIDASPGTFIWHNRFETAIISIELTQDGARESQRGELQSVEVDEDGNRTIIRERVIESDE